MQVIHFNYNTQSDSPTMLTSIVFYNNEFIKNLIFRVIIDILKDVVLDSCFFFVLLHTLSSTKRFNNLIKMIHKYIKKLKKSELE